MAAHISIAKRKEACLLLLRNHNDHDKTVSDLLVKWADDPVVARAKNKEKLLLNIISMGGSGLNFEANFKAMREAMSDYHDEMMEAQMAAKDREIERLQAALEREQSARADTEQDFRRVSEELNRMLMEGRAHNINDSVAAGG